MIVDGWFDWMERYSGAPMWKLNGGINTNLLYIPHSAVGYWPGFISRLVESQDKASVTGWIGYDGKCVQLYPVTANCWSSGSPYPNNNGIAFENEGGFQPVDEPLTDKQVESNARIMTDLAAYNHRPPGWWKRPVSADDINATLYEHRECVRFGSLPTACPSGRIRWSDILSIVNGATIGDVMNNGPYTYADFLSMNKFAGGQDFVGRQAVNASVDFKVPAAAKMIRVSFRAARGYMKVETGDGTLIDDQVGWGPAPGTPTQAVVDIPLGSIPGTPGNQWFVINAPESTNKLFLLNAYCIGWW